MTVVDKHHRFFDVPIKPVQTSAGDINLPILYYDTRCVNAFFHCDADRVARYLAGTGLHPATTGRGKVLTTVAFFEYRDTSVGTYNEVGIAVTVVPSEHAGRVHLSDLLRDVDNPQRQLGFHILHLPVTTEIACAAGREIWGYPKFVTPIDFGLSGRELNMRVADPANETAHICTLSGRAGPWLPGPPTSLLLYSLHQQQRLRTTVNVRGWQHMHRPGNVRLDCGQSDHPMATTLRALGLDQVRPWMIATTERFQSRLNGGHPL